MQGLENLLNLDFNALRTLRLVFRLGSFSAAAEALDVKQSTVSYTIERLRKTLGDPLIVRQGGRNEPTVRCREVIPIIDRILAEADSLQSAGGFDPARVKADVVILAATTVTNNLMPPVLRRILTDAPGISLSILKPEFAMWPRPCCAARPTLPSSMRIFRQTGSMSTAIWPMIILFVSWIPTILWWEKR